MAASHTYKLQYNSDFAVEPVRLACKFADIKPVFTPVRDMEEWKGMKAAACVLTVDEDPPIGQVTAVLRYFGILGGLYPPAKAPMAGLYVDEMIDMLRDLRSKVIACVYERNESRQAEQIEKLKNEILPETLGKMENAIKANKTGYCIGGSITIADLELAAFISWLVCGRGMPAEITAPYPVCVAVREKVYKHPKMSN
eukprot:GEMP01044592.1.p1 GENE.GEMP01044592.1~~GEMP01044592.1.p1  ORF type:complete len:198 (+),score=48.71 GEMP01044592.1:212-805(+)